jgi:hypothetical protein
LYNDSNGPKNGSVLRNNVVAKGGVQDLPALEPPMQRLVSAAHMALHRTFLWRVDSSAGALYLPRSFANVPVISHDSFKGVEVMN